MSVNYDFVVIGGGSGGSALAATLSSKGPTLLIERGANHSAFPQSYVREGWPQISTIAMKVLRNEGSGHWSGTANILGGGSSMNGAACWRGERAIFEALGFDIESIEDAFEILEERLCEPAEDTGFNQILRKAWSESGTGELKVDDASAGYGSWWADTTTTSNSSSIAPGSVQRSRTLFPPRSSANESKRRSASYLFEHAFQQDSNANSNRASSSIIAQGNLTVFLLTTAKRVLFNGNKDAIGVEVQSPSGDLSVYVRRGGKVFLSAGAYETPKLLILSGVGPQDAMSELNISAVYENSHVGKNLIDRKELLVSIPSLKKLQGDNNAIFDFAAIKDDYWASFAHKSAHGWGNMLCGGCCLCDPIDRTDSCREDILGGLLLYGGANRESNKPPYLLPYVVAQRRPRTRGSVTIASSDFSKDPMVHDGWSKTYENLSPDAMHDLEIFVNGARDLVMDLIQNSGLLYDLGFNETSLFPHAGNFSSRLVDTLLHYNAQAKNQVMESNGCDILNLERFPFRDLCLSWDKCVPTFPPLPKDESNLKKRVFESLSSSYHMQGTCRVGDVVEKETMAVIGVQGLYIADLSVLLHPVDIHPMMTAMSIGMTVGKMTESVPIGRLEPFPVVLSIGCMMVVACLILWSIIRSNLLSQEHTTDTKPSMNSHPAPLDEVCADSEEEQRFGDHDKKHLRDHGESRALMQWSSVSCSYEGGSSVKAATTLIDNFGSLNEGEITAIMGPSGASKSTILDILAGRKSTGTISGNISVLGQQFNFSSDGLAGVSNIIQSSSAYIPQQEHFYPTQTVEEAVGFTADMKSVRSTTEERFELIHSCLDAVGLDSSTYASRKIGGDLPGGITIRGLSGGERKRLALACVLAMKPKIMFIDEITSGLDSDNAESVIKLLKDLSTKQNVASMVIIHQPSPKVFSYFDRLILLSKGKCLFSGPIVNLSTFYETNYDEAIPMNANLANDLITKASANVELKNPLLYNGDFSEIDFVSAGSLPCLLSENITPNNLQKLRIVFKRNLTNQYIRNIANVGARLASYTLLSILMGTLFFDVGAIKSDPVSTSNFTFKQGNLLVRTDTFILFNSYLLPFSTIPVFIGDKRFFAAESALGMYAPWMYCCTQIFLEFAFVTLASIVQAGICIPMCKLWNPSAEPWVSFLTTLSVVVASGLVGSNLVFFFSMALPTQDLAFLAGSTVVTISLALSGGFLPFSEMASIPSALQWISPVKYSLQGLFISELKNTSAESILDIGKYRAPASVTENLIVLLGIYLLLSILTALSMLRIKEVR